MSELCSVPRVSERFAQSNALDEDIARLKFVSGKREEALRRLGIRTVRDLLLHIPHRYLDFTRSWSIEMAPIGTVCTIIATVDRIVQKQPRPRMQVTEVSLVDETGVLQVAFFRQPWIAQQLKQGDRLAVMGKVEFAYGFKQMASPHFEKLEDGRAAGTILPVHYVSDGVSQAWMRRIVSGALEVVANPFDPIPAPLRVKRRLMSNARALRSIHFPSSMAERDIARRRLAYEECLYLQLALRLRNDGGLVDVVPYAHTAGEHLAALKQALPFSLSDEQEAAVQDILRDMCDGGRVMNRLLLGDVGTGKTAVAACALAVAADSGTQACVMAPTGVLARQYADKTGPLLSQAGMSWALLTGATPAAEREQIHMQLESGELDVLFGTHAVLSDDVTFNHLSLVVIDKLPFAPPDDPIVSARSDAIRRRGGSPFGVYALPEAIISLKQGAGRLIRSETDRGVFMLCDARIAEKSYGKSVMKSLPDFFRTRSLEKAIQFFRDPKSWHESLYQ